MPLPTRKKDEKEQEFISRCASSDVMNKEFPDQKQKLAVCYSQARKANEEIEEPSEFEQKVDEIFDENPKK